MWVDEMSYRFAVVLIGVSGVVIAITRLLIGG